MKKLTKAPIDWESFSEPSFNFAQEGMRDIVQKIAKQQDEIVKECLVEHYGLEWDLEKLKDRIRIIKRQDLPHQTWYVLDGDKFVAWFDNEQKDIVPKSEYRSYTMNFEFRFKTAYEKSKFLK